MILLLGRLSASPGVARYTDTDGVGSWEVMEETGPTPPGTAALMVTGKDEPTNFAWVPFEGYQGLLLHAISPQLAERLYPYLATEAAEASFGSVLLVATIVSSLPLLAREVVPMWLTYFSFLVYLPAAHRVALLDLRVLRLLMRNFDAYYVFGNLAVLMWCVVGGMFEPTTVLYGFNMCISSFTMLVMDAVRLPFKATLQAIILYATLTLFWGLYQFLELGPRDAVNYQAKLFASVGASSVFVGRMVILGVFYARFGIFLWRHQDAYVMLHRPLMTSEASRTQQVFPEDGDLKTIQPAPDESPRPFAEEGQGDAQDKGGAQGPSKLLGTAEGKGGASSWLRSWQCEAAVMLLAAAGSLLSAVALFVPNVLSLGWAHASATLHVLALHRLALADMRVVRRLLGHFDLFWLMSNVVLALAMLRMGVFTAPEAAAASVHVLVSSICTLVIDSFRLSAAAKLRTAVLFVVVLGVNMCGYTFAPAPPMDYHKKFLGSVASSSFMIGRYFTLGIYVARYAVKLWLRPNVFVILKAPLMKHDTEKLQLRTLREAAKIFV